MDCGAVGQRRSPARGCQSIGKCLRDNLTALAPSPLCKTVHEHTHDTANADIS